MITSKVKSGSLVLALVAGMMACNGTDSSDKTSTDSATVAASAAATADSAARVKASGEEKERKNVRCDGHGRQCENGKRCAWCLQPC